MKKKIIKNYLLNMAYQVTIMLVSLVTPPYLARTIGAESIGIYGYTLSIATYFILFSSLGINLYGQREIAYVQNDRGKRTQVFIELMSFRLVTTIIGCSIFFIFFVLNGEYSSYNVYMLFAILSTLFDITWFFKGIENFKIPVIRSILIRLFSVIAIFIFVKQPSDLWKYFLIYMIGEVFGNISLWFNLKKYFGKINFKNVKIRRHLRPLIILFIPQVAMQIYTVLDKTMIGSILKDMNEVAYYDQSQKIIKLVLTIVTSLSVVMLPRMSNIFSCGDQKKVQQTMYKAFTFVSFLVFPLLFGLLLITNNFVPWYYGDGFDKVKLVLMVFAPIIFSIGFNDLIGVQYMVATKKQTKYTITIIIGTVINVAMNLILIPHLKSIGAAIASLIAETIVLISQYLFIRKEIKLRRIISSNHKFFFASLIMFCIVWLLKYTNMSGIIYTAVQIVFGAIVYVLVLILFKEENLLEIIEKIKKKVFKKQ